MSLDVYLNGEAKEVPCTCSTCDDEHLRKETEHFYDSNITHNLNRMAMEAGIYKELWRPDEIGITKASQLVEPLRAGLALMESDPPRFKKHDAENGWGTYEQFLPWIREYQHACERYPEANVSVSR